MKHSRWCNRNWKSRSFSKVIQITLDNTLIADVYTYREWYTSAASPPKDVVIIIFVDAEHNLPAAKVVAKLLIRMSNLQDQVR